MSSPLPAATVADPPSPPATLEAISGMVSRLEYHSLIAEKKSSEERLARAKLRLEHYMRMPDPVRQPNLYKLFLAIDVAQTKKISLFSMLSYILAILKMTLAGVLASLDMDKVEKTLTHNSRSIGSRLRLKRGIDQYALAVRASVGAQTVCREARQDFCDSALDGHKAYDAATGSWVTPTIDLDKAVEELALPYPAHFAKLLGQGGQPDTPSDQRFGDDISEARVAIDQLISSSVICKYIARIDELVAFVGTMTVACLAVIATVIIIVFPPSLLLSQVGASANTADQPCAFSIVGLGLPAGACIKPFAPIEDGSSIYKVNVYLAILTIGAPIIWVCIAGMALQALLGMTAEVLHGVDASQAQLMFDKHPHNLTAVFKGDASEAEKAVKAREHLDEGSFAEMQNVASKVKAEQDKLKESQSGGGAAAAAPPASTSCIEGLLACITLKSLRAYFGSFTERLTAFLMPSFKHEINTARNSVMCMESEDFLATYCLMREDVSDASKRVGINVSSMMTLITQGLGGLAVFLVVMSAMNFASGQRFVVIALFLFAIAWVHVLCSVTRDARVYSFLVLAESTKYLNVVLWIDQCLDLEELHKAQAENAASLAASARPPAPKTIAEHLNALRWAGKTDVVGALKWPWVKEGAKRAAGGLAGGGASAPEAAYTIQVLNEEEAKELAALKEAKAREPKASSSCSVQ